MQFLQHLKNFFIFNNETKYSQKIGEAKLFAVPPCPPEALKYKNETLVLSEVINKEAGNLQQIILYSFIKLPIAIASYLH